MNSIGDSGSYLSGSSFALNEPHSVANPADWAIPLQNSSTYPETNKISTSPLTLFQTMNIVQHQIRFLGMQWFYPDETMIICRIKEKDLYVVIQYEFEDDILLQLCKGSVENFAYICTSIEDAIIRAKMTIEDEKFKE